MALALKNPPASAGDVRDAGATPGSGRSPGGVSGHPLQHYCGKPRRQNCPAARPWDTSELAAGPSRRREWRKKGDGGESRIEWVTERSATYSLWISNMGETLKNLINHTYRSQSSICNSQVYCLKIIQDLEIRKEYSMSLQCHCEAWFKKSAQGLSSL